MGLFEQNMTKGPRNGKGAVGRGKKVLSPIFNWPAELGGAG